MRRNPNLIPQRISLTIRIQCKTLIQFSKLLNHLGLDTHQSKDHHKFINRIHIRPVTRLVSVSNYKNLNRRQLQLSKKEETTHRIQKVNFNEIFQRHQASRIPKILEQRYLLHHLKEHRPNQITREVLNLYKMEKKSILLA